MARVEKSDCWKNWLIGILVVIVVVETILLCTGRDVRYSSIECAINPETGEQEDPDCVPGDDGTTLPVEEEAAPADDGTAGSDTVAADGYLPNCGHVYCMKDGDVVPGATATGSCERNSNNECGMIGGGCSLPWYYLLSDPGEAQCLTYLEG